MDLILVDASHLFYRSWNAFKMLKATTGQKTGLQFGVMRTLQMMKKRFPQSTVIFCLDGRPSYRQNLSPDYKAHRNSNEEVHAGTNLCIEMLHAAGVVTAYHPDFESDDLIAMLCKNPDYDHCYVYSGDDDFCQLASVHTTIWKPPAPNAKGKEKDRFLGPNEVFHEWSVRPESLALYRSFTGDVSDEIKGLPRVPRAPLQTAINQCRVPEDFYKSESLTFFSKEWIDRLWMFREQCELNFRLTKLPYAYLEEVPLQYTGLVPEELRTLLTALEFKSMTTKFDMVVAILQPGTDRRVNGRHVPSEP